MSLGTPGKQSPGLGRGARLRMRPPGLLSATSRESLASDLVPANPWLWGRRRDWSLGLGCGGRGGRGARLAAQLNNEWMRVGCRGGGTLGPMEVGASLTLNPAGSCGPRPRRGGGRRLRRASLLYPRRAFGS